MTDLPDDTDERPGPKPDAEITPKSTEKVHEMEYPTVPVHSFNHYNYPPRDDYRRDGIEELILSNQIGGGFRDTLSTIHDSSINVMQSVEHNGLAGIQETARQGSTNLGATERNGGEVRATVERSAGDTGARVERNGGEVRASVERNHGETRAHLDRLQIALFGEICDVRKEASDNKSEILLDACKNTHALTLQAAENASRAQLQASENAARASRELAECCCKLEGVIASGNAATQALIRDTEQGRLRDALAAKDQQLLLLQINGNGPGNSIR